MRQPARRGKVVTQEELAEAIGVSRVWYAMLESGTALKTSPRLLTRLAEVLALSDERRAVLFRLALPEIPVGDRAFAALNDLSSIIQLRTAARRLHSATSESEVLLTVSETISGVFGDSDIAGAFKRLQPGRWDYPVVMGGEKWANAMAEMNHVLYEGMTPEQIDETMLYRSFAEPGHAGNRNELFGKLSCVALTRRLPMASEHATFSMPRRDGIEANVFALYVKGQKDFTETDRAVFGTLADLASLALS